MSRSVERLELDSLLAGRWETRVVPGLERIVQVLAALGSPETRYPSVLVLGTNGKGSTCAFLASLLQAMGLKVGLYTSPHLVRVEERIRINGKPLAPQEVLSWVRQLESWPQLSFFETLTAVAFAAFAEHAVDVAVVEAGLGGRWDATNAKRHEVALLTNVGTDHREWLGPTRAHIAAEKAAAIRGCEGILGQWDRLLLPIIKAHADPATPLTPATAWAQVRLARERRQGLFCTVTAKALGSSWTVQLPLAGRFQVANYRLALAGLAALCHHRLIPTPSVAALIAGTQATQWPGRLQPLHWRGKCFFLDGAHNLEAVGALVTSLRQTELAGELDLIFSCLADKPLAAMARRLLPVVRQVQVVPVDSPRGRDLDELQRAFPGSRAAASLRQALEEASPERPTLITGSLRLVGEALAVLQADPWTG